MNTFLYTSRYTGALVLIEKTALSHMEMSFLKQNIIMVRSEMLSAINANGPICRRGGPYAICTNYYLWLALPEVRCQTTTLYYKKDL